MSDFLLRRARTHYSDVNHWLTIGGDLDLAEGLTGAPVEATIDHLLDHGVSHVLDLRDWWHDADLWVDAGLPPENYGYVPIIDSRQHVPDESWFTDIEAFVDHYWATSRPGDRLYVHCQMGVNRGPTGAMVALLHTWPTMSPWEAFQTVRQARPAAGVVYAKHVGIRHIIQSAGGWDGDTEDETYRKVADFTEALQRYWTPQRINEARGDLTRAAIS